MTPVDHPTSWSSALPQDHNLNEFSKNLGRSVGQPTEYRLNGAIYLVRTEYFRQKKTLFAEEGSFAFIMSRERSIDVDTAWDLRLAQFSLQTSR